MHSISDFRPTLQAAVAHLRQAGFASEADELQNVLGNAWTSSSEMLGEIGTTILQVKRQLGSSLPIIVDQQFQSCLAEVRKVWPALR